MNKRNQVSSIEGIWSTAKEADDSHPLLLQLDLKSYGLKCHDDLLLIALTDTSGTIRDIQCMSFFGNWYMLNVPITGLFFQLGPVREAIVVITKDYATAAKLHRASGVCAVVAFSASNMVSLANLMRANRPAYNVLIVPDGPSLRLNFQDQLAAICKLRNHVLTYQSCDLVTDRGISVPQTTPHQHHKNEEIEDAVLVVGKLKDAPDQTRKSVSCDVVTETKGTYLAPPNRLPERSSEEVTCDESREGNAIPECTAECTCDAVTAKFLPVVSSHHRGPVVIATIPAEASVLLDDISLALTRFVACSEEVVVAVTLWITMTWFMNVVKILPIALITAAEKRCGKTQLLTLIAKLACRPLQAANVSAAATYRVIDTMHPTLIIDEADTFLDRNKELVGIINGSHSRDSAYVIRLQNGEPKKYSTWGPKAIAGIGRVTDTLQDRSIVLPLRRKLPHESRDRLRNANPEIFKSLISRLENFSVNHSEEVARTQTILPEQLSDRAQDNWEPLLMIAKLAGKEWYERAVFAALVLSGNESDTYTPGQELLRDIRNIFLKNHSDRIFTEKLIEVLCEDMECRWATYHKGRAITPRQISSILKEYKIISRTIRMGSATAKGYHYCEFEDAFARYL